MNFPKFWAKGTQQQFTCWRWSDSSLAEAASLAQEAARRLAERFAAGDKLQHGYGYPDRPVREPVLREIKAPGGEVAAVITRNAYGALVLNTARIMFVDVDLPEPKSPVGGWLKKLFGKPEPPAAIITNDSVMARAEAWSQRHPGWGWRVYRTKAGLRLLATHALFEPESACTEQVFDALGADPLYRRLCRTQKCFRARLTPKPWRCGFKNPPGRWPWPDAKAEARYKDWEARYQKACMDFATCELAATPGSQQVDPTVQLIVKIHDEMTLAESKLDLA
ncbi:MAG TPA: hypothetical protein VGR14_00675 [Verrucomicrobiae bacterium]|jgi:hypothetical protein|nr:hypothetical protein [Verrucomicrobiae bacterium]